MLAHERKMVEERNVTLVSSAGSGDKYFGGGRALWDHLRTLSTYASPCWFEGAHCAETPEVLQTLGQKIFGASSP